MTITLRKAFFAMATMIVLLGAIQPTNLSAQTSGVGSDSYTRFMWTGTDDRISLWRLNPSLGGAISHQYGPYDQYIPIAMTVGSNNYTYVLWKRTDGAISLWLVDPNLNYVTSRVYGPYAGWIPESMSISENGANNLRIIWRETQGMVSVWSVNSTLSLLSSVVYGPFFGFSPTSAALSAVSSETDANAKSAMTHDTVSAPMPRSNASSN